MIEAADPSKVCGLHRSWSMTRILVMSTQSLATVKSHFSAVVDSVHDTHERVVVTKNGEPAVVLMAVEDLESLEETLAILRDEATMRDLAQADAEVVSGETLDADELRDLVARRGLKA
jgi:antitoxin YefM